jgi:hypothetical protein
MSDNVIPFRGNDSGSPPLPPIDPRMAAFLLQAACQRLDRLQGALNLLRGHLKSKDDSETYSLSSLASLCSAEVENLHSDICQIVNGLEADSRPGAAPEGGKPRGAAT